MNVSQAMKTDIITIAASATVRDAVRGFANNQISVLPVVDDTDRPLGVVRLRNLLRQVLPAFIDLMDDFDYVGDFGAVKNRAPDDRWLAQPVTAVFHPVETVPTTCSLLRAYAIMLKEGIFDLQVVDGDGRLVGLASRVDIGRALLSSWHVETDSDDPA